MIADRTQNIAIQSNVPATGTAMSLDADATEHLIGLLTDLYSDPELAVVREYATNALDANRAAGNGDPIEVTLPTDLSPFYRVKDEGIGLSVDDLYNTYAKYGRSTKRESNEFNGMLGLGCKSALTYTDQFTVVARKDGVQATVSISRGENGVGTLTVVDTSATSERNGVEVIIPAKAQSSIGRKAQDFFRFWEAGTVLVNGEEPKPFSGIEVSDDLLVTTDLNNDYVVMGNVAYPARIGASLPWQMNVVARVPIGAVHFTPSREALHMTTKTEAAVGAIRTDVEAGLKAAVEKHVAAQPDRRTAMREVIKWNGILPRQYQMTDLKYQGVELPTQFKLGKMPDGTTEITFTTVARHTSALNRHGRSTYVYAATAFSPDTVYLTGYDRPSFTSAQKKKMIQWCEENGVSAEHFILLPGAIPAKYKAFIDADRVHPWAPIQAVKLPRAAGVGRGQSGRIPGSYDMFTQDGWQDGMPADDIDQDNPVFYEMGGWSEGKAFAKYLTTSMPDGFTLVMLTSNRLDKFLRNFPQAARPAEQVKLDARKFAKTITAEQRMALSIQGGGYYGPARTLKLLDPARVNDPDVVEAIRLVNLDVTAVSEKMGEFFSLIRCDFGTTESSDPLEAYPLLDSDDLRRHADEVYGYMNWSYANRLAAQA